MNVFTRTQRLRFSNKVGPFAYRMKRASSMAVKSMRLEHESAPALDVALVMNMCEFSQREAWQYYHHLAPCSFVGIDPKNVISNPYRK